MQFLMKLESGWDYSYELPDVLYVLPTTAESETRSLFGLYAWWLK